jgi:hypothetical protein
MTTKRPPRKHRSHSPLNTLPQDRQAAIIQWLDCPAGIEGTLLLARQQFSVHTPAAALSELASDGNPGEVTEENPKLPSPTP